MADTFTCELLQTKCGNMGYKFESSINFPIKLIGEADTGQEMTNLREKELKSTIRRDCE